MNTARVPRLWIIAAIAMALLFGILLYSGNVSGEPTLTVVSFGGAYQKAQRRAYMEPFEAESNIRIIEGEYDGGHGILAQRATAPIGAWDVVSVEAARYARGANEGLFLQLPTTVFDGVNLIPEAKRSHAAGHLAFSTILAYDERRFEDPSRAPQSWADFWDVRRFPGDRGLRNAPRGTLEIALLADGVEPSELYPLDIQRAFAKLDALRTNLVFWESGGRPVELLATKRVVMSSVYNGRIWDARVNEGLPVRWVFDQGLFEVEYWAVLRNAPNPAAAFQFISLSLRADRQAAFTNLIAYSPTNSDALALVSEQVRRALPTAPSVRPSQIVVNADWWAANEDAVDARWEQWQSRN